MIQMKSVGNGKWFWSFDTDTIEYEEVDTTQDDISVRWDDDDVEEESLKRPIKITDSDE